jgi:DNA polymerase III epsilon subunit-like protein
LDFQPFTKEAKVQTDQKASCHDAFRNDLERIPKHKIVINRQNNIIRHSLCPEHTFSNVTKQTNMEHLGSFTAIDTETTGLHPSSDLITEVTAIRFRNWEPVEIFSTLVNPGRKIPAVVTAKTGIDNSMVQNQPAFAEIADDLASFIGSDNIVGHNLSFDMQFLECSGMDLSLPKKRKFYDTLKLARYTLVKYGQKVWDPDEGGYTESDEWDVMDYKLTTLCDYYGIRDNSSAHRAASDAYATGILFHMLAESKVSK